MICGTFTVRDIPPEKVEARIKLWKAMVPPPISVMSGPDGQGNFIIVAVFPPCDKSTTHSDKESG